MENNGFIKLYRKFLDWEWHDNPKMVSLFLHFLLLANHKEKKWHGQIIKTGQFITGRKSLSKLTGISERSIRTLINRLKSTSEIASKSTNKYSVISILKWEKYQTNRPANRPTDRPTTDQQLTTNKNDKNDKKNIADKRIRPMIDYFYKAYKAKLGITPIIAGGKDGRLIKMRLSQFDENSLKSLFDYFLTLPKSRDHPSLSAALSADTINLWQLNNKKSRELYV